jgi:hypothetical protein
MRTSTSGQIVGFLILLIVFCAQPATADEIIDQSNPAIGTGATNIGSDLNFELGQSFTPTAENLSSVMIYFAENTATDKNTPVRITIWKSDSLDFTSGLQIGTKVQIVPEGPSADDDPFTPVHRSTAIFTFNPPLIVESGEVYVIQISEAQVPSNTDLSWRAGGSYPGGMAIKDGQPTYWSDRSFQTFTEPNIVHSQAMNWCGVKSLFK